MALRVDGPRGSGALALHAKQGAWDGRLHTRLKQSEASVLRMNLKELLKRALSVGAVEVKLIPGRRTVVGTSKGENEVRGDAQTPETINSLLKPVMTPEARRSLSAGWAEWAFELEGKGLVRATCELKMGLIHAAFFLESCEDTADAAAPPAARSLPARVPAAPRVPPAPRPPLEVPLRRAEETLPELASSVPPAQDVEAPEPLRTVPPLPREHQATAVGLSSGSSRQIDSLLLKMLDTGASDLHVSSAHVPMLRIDGEM